MKSGDEAPRPLPRKRGGGGGREVVRESRGCEGYPEGTNCSGVRRGCCQHTSCQHTPGARHTHTHMHAHTPPGLALSVRTTLPTVPPLPPSPPIHPHPPQPLKTQSGISLQRQLWCQARPAAGPARVYFTKLETRDD